MKRGGQVLFLHAQVRGRRRCRLNTESRREGEYWSGRRKTEATSSIKTGRERKRSRRGGEERKHSQCREGGRRDLQKESKLRRASDQLRIPFKECLCNDFKTYQTGSKKQHNVTKSRRISHQTSQPQTSSNKRFCCEAFLPLHPNMFWMIVWFD